MAQSVAELKQLQVLYLHGNNITDMSELHKLSSLKQLTKLAVHGNELISIEPDTKKKSVARLGDTPFYRSRYVRARARSLASFVCNHLCACACMNLGFAGVCTCVAG